MAAYSETTHMWGRRVSLCVALLRRVTRLNQKVKFLRLCFRTQSLTLWSSIVDSIKQSKLEISNWTADPPSGDDSETSEEDYDENVDNDEDEDEDDDEAEDDEDDEDDESS